MNRAALFCDETIEFRIPAEPDSGDIVTLRFRTAKDDVDHVYAVICGQDEKIELEKAETKGLFDYYECKVPVGEDVLYFYFEIKHGDEVRHYNRLGVSDNKSLRKMFRITPGFHVPEWSKGAVMYQIFVDRFYNGDPKNDVLSDEYVYIGFPVTKVDKWDSGVSLLDVDRFYGGDIQGIIDKLDYLQSLKVEVLYLSPVFVSPSNHKYDCQDYAHVDPHYGVIVKDTDGLVTPNATTNEHAEKYAVRTADPENLKASDEFFAKFVEEIHKRGMRIILDGVFNHCGSFNKWLDREKIYEKQGGYEPGAYASANSPYKNFFKFKDNGEEAWPNNQSYEGWWDYNTLPKLNYEESQELYDYILEIGKKWVSPPYNIDGWRLDVAADLGHSPELNHRFWKDFRKAVKEANPEAVILAEHYGDVSPWLQGDEWDTVMNYDAFMEPLTWFLTGLEKHSDCFDAHLYQNSQAFMSSMLDNMTAFQTPSLLCAMNELSNHDHSRFLTRTNRKVGRIDTRGAAAADEGLNFGTFRSAAIVQMTWPGAPTIYYGDEAGVCGWTDPDNRRTYPWGHENQELIEFHRYLVNIRKKNPAFRNGCIKPLLAEAGIVAYGRFDKENRGVVVVNSTGYKKRVRIPVWLAEVEGDHMWRVMKSTEIRYNVGRMQYPVDKGMMTIEIDPHCSMIFEEKKLDF